MGRSSKKNSCLRIITCSRGDDVADDDPPVNSSQTQRTEKRRWSFRRKSADHIVGSSTIISETVIDSLDTKKSDQNVANNCQCPKNSSVSFSEKLPLRDIQYEIPEGSLVKSAPYDVQHQKPETSLVLAEPELVEKHAEVEISEIMEFSVVRIQAFIRGCLVRRELPKQKNVIKLQAVVRGHLVRRQAVGTLRCSLAILKMQALIRARHARIYLKKFDINQQEKTDDIMKLDKNYNSTKSLISNGFARRLLELSPKTKPIYISCDHSKSNSAWKWFERWMAVTTTEEPKTIPEFYETCGTLERLSTSADSKLAGNDATSENSSGREFHDPLLCLEIDNQGVIDVKNEIDTSSKLHTENVAFGQQIFDGHLEKNDVVDSFQDNLESKTMVIIDGNAVSHNLTPEIDGSECGTELSISSTLDSPDRSEAEGEILMEFGSSEKEHNVVNGHSNVLTEHAGKKLPVISEDQAEPKKLDVSDKQLNNSAASLSTDLQSQAEFTTTTITTVENEMHGTPASQKPVKERKKKRESKKTDGKAITQTTKKSPLNITKDSNNIKKRNFLGTDSRLDHVDQEPRMSNSGSVPSYMQATESARAKVNANVSPRSSPDLYNKESHLKKRHSLPMVFGKQGTSPRIQRSPSQSDKNPKGSAHSPLNSAERRWQR